MGTTASATQPQIDRRRRDRKLHKAYRPLRCNREPSVEAILRRQSTTDAARELSESLKIAALEREVSRLQAQMRFLLDTREGLNASIELEAITPSAATLKLWADQSNPPEDLLDKVEERPW